jgi:hypothetical protein
MPKISLRHLLAKLTVLALATGAATGHAATTVDSTPELDASLVLDRGQLDAHDVASTLGRSLALALTGMRPLSATHVVATWSLSDDPVRRHAVACALEWPFPVVGDAVAIEHLASDPDPSIRAAVARAAWMRSHTQVLDRLTADADGYVRDIARGR